MKEGHAARSINAPKNYTALIGALPQDVIVGLINAHVHLTLDNGAPDPYKALRDEPPTVTAIRAARRARRMLEAGITTARDLGGVNYFELAVRDLIKSGEIPGPRLLCAGKQITMTGGQGWTIGRESDGPDDVRKAVREQLKASADLIKLMATGGVLTLRFSTPIFSSSSGLPLSATLAIFTYCVSQ